MHTSVAPFDSIPVDCGAKVFSFLGVTEACSHARSSSSMRAFVTRSLGVQRSVTFVNGRDGDPSEWLENMATRCRNINAIDFGFKVSPAHVLRQACACGHSRALDVILRVFPRVNLKYDNLKVPKRAHHKVKGVPLHLALDNGHMEIFERLMNVDRIQIGGLSRQHESLLHICADKGLLSTLDDLLRSHRSCFDVNRVSASVNYDRSGRRIVRDRRGTPLHCAARNGHTSVVKRLLDEPLINFNARYRTLTPLSFAVHLGQASASKLLLQHLDMNQNLNIHDSNIGSLLKLAARRGFLFVVQALLESDMYDVNPYVLKTAMYNFFSSGPDSPEGALLFLNNPTLARMDCRTRRDLFDMNARFGEAVRRGNLKVVKLLLDINIMQKSSSHHHTNQQEEQKIDTTDNVVTQDSNTTDNGVTHHLTDQQEELKIDEQALNDLGHANSVPDTDDADSSPKRRSTRQQLRAFRAIQQPSNRGVAAGGASRSVSQYEGTSPVEPRGTIGSERDRQSMGTIRNTIGLEHEQSHPRGRGVRNCERSVSSHANTSTRAASTLALVSHNSANTTCDGMTRRSNTTDDAATHDSNTTDNAVTRRSNTTDDAVTQVSNITDDAVTQDSNTTDNGVTRVSNTTHAGVTREIRDSVALQMHPQTPRSMIELDIDCVSQAEAAIRQGRMPILKLLLEQVDFTAAVRSRLLERARAAGSTAIIDLLLHFKETEYPNRYLVPPAIATTGTSLNSHVDTENTPWWWCD